MTRPTRGRIVSVELGSGGGESVTVPAGELAYVVARRAGRVVGRRVLDGPASLAELSFPEVPPPPAAGPPASDVSVVVATRDRPGELALCLAALGREAAGVGEIVVCDSASADSRAVAEVVARAGAVLVRCDRPGLSLARNTGAIRSVGEVIAFLDDDCRVEPGWLDAIRGGFSDTRVAAVTGSYLPAELEHEAQVLFLRYAHMDRRGFAAHRFSLRERESRHWPLDAWRMGSGGNLAVRAETLRKLGGFRLDLGLGTPARGGEDLFLLWSIVRSGGDVVYRPDAMVSHRHHRDLASLNRVMSGYGTGHAAYLTAARLEGASTRIYGLSVLYDRAKRAARALFHGDRATLALVAHETRGLLS